MERASLGIAAEPGSVAQNSLAGFCASDAKMTQGRAIDRAAIWGIFAAKVPHFSLRFDGNSTIGCQCAGGRVARAHAAPMNGRHSVAKNKKQGKQASCF
jgi:hypothetical protein